MVVERGDSLLPEDQSGVKGETGQDERLQSVPKLRKLVTEINDFVAFMKSGDPNEDLKITGIPFDIEIKGPPINVKEKMELPCLQVLLSENRALLS